MSRSKSIDRDHVLDVAQDIVVQRGAGALTIDAVAKAAGITKGGVQSCFGTKENLISAMLKRWEDAYDEARNGVEESEPGRLTFVQKHVRVTGVADTLNAKAASLLAALVQSKEMTSWFRNLYARQLGSLDLSTDDGRRARLAFLAAEGAFMLRYFDLAKISDSEWRDIFRDIERCADPTRPVDVR